ncbi:hypothetical protein O181_013188 [Austropuccinia psidii MF-1]|uniref:Uncharacterized protein n=1 Tax=Austropuccinia psidii MF-1 TaxID=1389203 RepID=A0A9Q3BYR5_9BASI|nr:hypothetical protein [Austropuccinia psidii MF-1]
MYWLLKIKDILTSLHPDMSETLVHKRISRKFGGDLECAIKNRFSEPFSTEDYINSMEDITTRTKIGRNWYKPPVDNNNSGKPISRPNKPQGRAPFKEAFASDDKPLGAIEGCEVDITLNLERPYPPLLRVPSHPARPRPRE